MAKVITANLLRSGDVAYLGRDGQWVSDIGAADVVEDEASLQALEQEAAAAQARQEVLSVYAMDVVVDGGRPSPQSVREKIRAGLGPTVGSTAGSFRSAA